MISISVSTKGHTQEESAFLYQVGLVVANLLKALWYFMDTYMCPIGVVVYFWNLSASSLLFFQLSQVQPSLCSQT